MLLPPDKKEEEDRERRRDHHINYQTVTRDDDTVQSSSPGPSRGAGHSQPRSRAQDVHAIGEGDGDGGDNDNDAWSTETTQLLPPPYSEAAAGSKKDRRKRLMLQSAVALLFASLWFGFLAIVWVKSRDNRNQNVWTRGGSNGKGGWDHIWSHRTPLLPSETSPHSCDMFNEPVVAPSWSSPISTGPTFMATTNFSFPLPLKKLFIHARAPNLYGIVEIEAAQDTANRPVNSISAGVDFLTHSVSNLAGWHVCQAGSSGEHGIFIVGPEGSETSNSPWNSHFLKFSITLIMPQGVKPSDLRQEGDVWYLGDLEIDVPGMSVTFSGDFKAQKIGFAELNVRTARSGITVADSLLVQRAYIMTTDAAIAAERLEAVSEPLVLTSQNGPILCNKCQGETLILHTSNALIHGVYSATKSIDVYTSGNSITGFYRAPEVWMRTDRKIQSNVEIVEVPSPEKMSLLCATSLSYLDVDLAFTPLVGGRPHGDSFDSKAKASITMSTSEAFVNLNVRNIPAHRAIDMHIDTRNSPVTARIAKEYQGDFILRTVKANVFRHDEEDEDDDGDSDDRVLKFDNKSTQAGVVKGSIASPGVTRDTLGIEWGSIDIGGWGNSNIVLDL